MTRTVRELVTGHQILVSCGAGGVGKTTVAAALALAGARLGRRVLALTVDPSRRLAETLGVQRNLRRPVSIPAGHLAQAGITTGGDRWRHGCSIRSGWPIGSSDGSRATPVSPSG